MLLIRVDLHDPGRSTSRFHKPRPEALGSKLHDALFCGSVCPTYARQLSDAVERANDLAW